MTNRREQSVHSLLKTAHANKQSRTLGKDWRSSVMADVRKQDISSTRISEWERVAPRFTYAATALSIALLITATLVFNGLSGTIDSALYQQAFSSMTVSINSL